MNSWRVGARSECPHVTTSAANAQSQAEKSPPPRVGGHPPFECTALLLQRGRAGRVSGRGVPGARRGGCSARLVAGISIGAINSALIAGNPLETRVEKLREFW